MLIKSVYSTLLQLLSCSLAVALLASHLHQVKWPLHVVDLEIENQVTSQVPVGAVFPIAHSNDTEFTLCTAIDSL